MDGEKDLKFSVAELLASDSDSESDIDLDFDLEHQQPQNTFDKKSREIVELQIKNRLSNRAASQVAKLMNSMPDVSIKLPVNPMKHISRDINFHVLFNCESCDEVVPEPFVCECGQTFKADSKKNNFMIYIPLEPQIRRLIKIYYHEIVNYLNRKHVDGVLSDVDDGTVFRTISSRNSNTKTLGLTLNTDGAEVFENSGGFSLWPVQLYANFLPPNIRYSSKNIIISTLHYGKGKPDMSTLLYPIAAELDHLNEKGILMHRENEILCFCVSVNLFAFDLPARADIQGMKGAVGKFGCSFCYHPGKPIKNNSGTTTIRFIYESQPHKLRTHDETVLMCQRATKKDFTDAEKDAVNGMKMFSPLLLFKNIDVISSITIDSVHGAFLGVTKHIVEIWIGKKSITSPPYKDYKIKTMAQRQLLSNRIMSLKPTSNFCRKPRSILEVGKYKASELMHCLFYYLRYSLVGLLPTKIIKNFEKFSAAIYILSKKEISLSEIESARKLLIQFVGEFQAIYGEGAITMNIHALLHYCDMVLNCGPLWAHNMFGFESKIGDLGGFVCGPTDVLNQIASKYVISLNAYPTDIEQKGKKTQSEQDSFDKHLSQKSKIALDPKFKPIFAATGVDDYSIQIWKRIKIKGTTYTSTSAVVTKSIDYFVQMLNGHIGKIQFFFGDERKPNVLLQEFEIIDQNFHWTEVEEIDSYKIYNYDQIHEKLLYFKAGSIQYITKEPNSYGRGESKHTLNLL